MEILRDKNLFDFNAIIDECNRLRHELQQISNRYDGPLESGLAKNTKLPFALILGNHSSGKSTFINYMLQSNIQASGVAPTDDCFTIITYGESDSNRNGSAVVGDPDLGFHDLVQFGPMLVHKTQLKVRSNIAVRDMMIIDSPGMIDAPSTSSDPTKPAMNDLLDRGYDFQASVRWFAERADVILIFFDPDKPGTTSETLSILTKAVTGFDQKILLILNKADRFRKVHDFARAYGSLCWNLAKIIPRKDLPQIYTMCVPRHHNAEGRALLPVGLQSPVIQEEDHESVDGNVEEDAIACCIKDLDATRDEVIAEVLNAPKRRIDNEISRLTESANELMVHVRVMDAVICKYQAMKQSYRLHFTAAVVTGSIATTAVALRYDSLKNLFHALLPSIAASTSSILSKDHHPRLNEVIATASVGLSSALAIGGLSYYHSYRLRAFATALLSSNCLSLVFDNIFHQSHYGKNLSYLTKLWHRIAGSIQSNIDVKRLQRMPRVNPADMRFLVRLQDDAIPALRRRASPNFQGLSPQRLESSLLQTPTRLVQVDAEDGEIDTVDDHAI